MRLCRLYARVLRAAICVVLLLPTVPVSAQSTPAFDTLATRVNMGDRVRVESATGQRVTGRLTQLSRRQLVVRASGRDVAFDAASVRTLSVESHPFRRSVLVGMLAFAALGATATCVHDGGATCVVVGGVRTAPIGLGVGLAAGAALTRMRPVYRRGAAGADEPPPLDDGGLLDDLGRTVNLGDRLRITDDRGVVRSGRLAEFSDEALTLHTRDGAYPFTRATLRSVAVQRRPIRAAVLTGAVAGAGLGAVLACTGDDRSECGDGPILLGALGALLGGGVGSLMRQTTVVFPEAERHTSIEPLVTPCGAGLFLVRRW